MKSAMSRHASRRGGSISVNINRCSVVICMSALTMYSTWSVPVAVLDPSARTLLTAVLGQLAPVPVDLFLRLAHDHEGDAFREVEARSAVEGEVLAAVEDEIGSKDLALGDRAAVLLDLLDVDDLR